MALILLGQNLTPEVFIKASQMLNVPIAECAVVEDAKAGIDAANAGAFFQLVLEMQQTMMPQK